AALPYGKQRLLEIALAIACGPRVLLLDEPAAGVPEAERHELLATIAALPKDVTVLLIEHDMDLVFSFADRISVLVNGSLLAEGPSEQVACDPRVQAAYLGESADAWPPGDRPAPRRLWGGRRPAPHVARGGRGRSARRTRPQRHGQDDADQFDRRRHSPSG